MRIGFDLDGVLCDISLSDLILFHQNGDKDDIYYYKERKPLLNPYTVMTENDLCICVTARKSCYHNITQQWMKKYYFGLITEFLEQDYEWYQIQLIARAKIEIFNKHKIEIYFDDSPKLIKEMRKQCKSIKFIQYGGRI